MIRTRPSLSPKYPSTLTQPTINQVSNILSYKDDYANSNVFERLQRGRDNFKQAARLKNRGLKQPVGEADDDDVSHKVIKKKKNANSSKKKKRTQENEEGVEEAESMDGSQRKHDADFEYSQEEREAAQDEYMVDEDGQEGEPEQGEYHAHETESMDPAEYADEVRDEV